MENQLHHQFQLNIWRCKLIANPKIENQQVGILSFTTDTCTFYCLIKSSLWIWIILRSLEIMWKCSDYVLLLTNFYSRWLYFAINKKYTWSRRLIFAIKIYIIKKIINQRHLGLVCGEIYSTRRCFHEPRENSYYANEILLSVFHYHFPYFPYYFAYNE